MLAVWIILGVVVIVAIWAIAGYNRMVSLREQVRFSHHDILSSRPPPGDRAFDLVCFRNVLIYLGHEVQDLALHSVRRAVRDEGYLCLGEAEWPSPDSAATLRPLAHETRIFRVA